MSKDEYVRIPRELAEKFVKYYVPAMDSNSPARQLVDCVRPQLKTVEERRAERLALPWVSGSPSNGATLHPSYKPEDFRELKRHAAEMAQMLERSLVYSNCEETVKAADDLLTRAKWYSEADNG